MFKFFLIFVLSIFFIACSGNSSSKNKDKVSYLSIAKAPVSTAEPVSIDQKIVLLFTAPINPITLSDSSAYIKDVNNTNIGLSIDYSIDTNLSSLYEFVLTPYEYLKPSQLYTLVVTTSVESILGESLSADYNLSFTTAADTVDDTNLTFEAFKPSSGLDADPLTDISIEFSKNISSEPEHTDAQIFSVTTGGQDISGSVEVFNSILTFKPDNPLSANTTYNVDLVGDIFDMYGNQYVGDTNWSFTTTYTLPINFGYKALNTRILLKPASIIRTMHTPIGANVVAVAVQGGVDFFDMSVTSGYPSLSAKYSYSISSQINSMEIFDDSYVIIGTMSDGVYVLKADDTNVSQISNIASTTPIYGVATGKNDDLFTDMAYAVGPDHGLEVFSVGENKTLTSLRTVDMNDSVPLKVVAATAADIIVTDEVTLLQSAPLRVLPANLVEPTRKVYVADYKGSIEIFDKDGNFTSSIDLNGSIRNLRVIKDYDNVPAKIFATSSLGTSSTIFLDGEVYADGYVDILSSANEISNYADIVENNFSKVYISDPSNGVMVLDYTHSDSNMTKEGIISTLGHVVSTSPISDTNSSFLATLDQEGIINIFNAVSDTTVPAITQIPPPYDYNTTTFDANITVTFDEYINPDTIDNDSFVLTYDSDPLVSEAEIITLVETTDDPKTYLIKLNDTNLSFKLLVADVLHFTIKGTIEDMVGNYYNDGLDDTYDYNTTAQ